MHSFYYFCINYCFQVVSPCLQSCVGVDFRAPPYFIFSNISAVMDADSCLFVSLEEVKRLGIIRSSVAFISALSCLATIVLILAVRLWTRFTNRLTLYLTILAFFYSLPTAFQWVSYSAVEEQPGGRSGCKAVAFFVQYSSWSLLIFTFLLTVMLFIGVYKGKKLHFKQWEIATLLAPILFPIIIAWIPFVNGSYGLSGIWCWISSHEHTNCTIFIPGVIEQAMLWYVPISILMIISSVLMLMTVGKYIYYHVLKSQKYQSINGNPQMLYMRSLKEFSPLLFYPIVFYSLNLIALSSRIASIEHAFPRGLLYIHATIDPCWGLLISVATTIYTVNIHCRTR